MTVERSGEAATVDADPARMLADARALSYPRYPGTEGDRRAIEWLRSRFEALGLTVKVEPFSYDIRPVFRLLSAVLILSALLLAAAGWTLHLSRGLAWGLLAGAVLPPLGLLGWSPRLEGLYVKAGPTKSANVAAVKSGSPSRRTIVVLAHHDSKSQNLTLPVRMGLTLAGLGGTTLLVAVLLLAGAPAWLGPAAGSTAGLALAGLSSLRSGNHSPGGVDNAGSVAILLELARLLPSRVPTDVELVFLSPGAEEDHMIGAMRWLDLHAAALVDPVALNLDGAGAPGRIVLIDRFGFGRRFAPTVSSLVLEVAGRHAERLRRILLPPAMGVDGIPFVHRAIECPTLASGGPGRAAWSVHSRHDRPDLLDGEMLERVARLTGEVVLALAAREGGPR